MKTSHWAMAIVGLLLLLLSVWQGAAAARGLDITALRNADPPLTLVTPRGIIPGSRPLLLLGHGFAASSAIMRGFAFSLAYAGYPTLLWDFAGHGANPRPLPSGMSGDTLLADAEAALAGALARGYGDSDQVAILGHSMGSGVALSFGQARPDTAATIAVSPVSRVVTPELPHNLLLLVGALEPPFGRNAEHLLSEAGGSGGDPKAGTARRLVVVPGVEHLSILFSPTAHAIARDWLDAVFGSQPGAVAYTDRRVLWYGLGVVGSLLLGAALAPLLADPADEGAPRRAAGRRLAALAGGALGATLILWGAGLAGLELPGLLGLLVGGYLMLWFALAGLLSLGLLWLRPVRLSWQALLGGLLAFAVLWLGVGLLGQGVWLSWLLIPSRLRLWPLGVLLLLPWFLAAGEMVRGAHLGGRIGWWLACSLVLASALFLALRLSPELSFLLIILLLFPILLGLHALAAAPYRGSWPFALSGAFFVSWLLLSVFPLQ